MRLPLRRLSALFGLALLAGMPVRADVVQVEQAPAPVPFLQPTSGIVPALPAVDATLEASAAEPIGDGGLLLVADDKTNGLLVVDARTGRRIGEPLWTAAFPVAEAKWEAMARDDDGGYYVIGSYSGWPQDLAAHSFLFRFRLRGGGADGPVAIDSASVARIDIAPALTAAGLYNLADPTKNRVRIEGLAVRDERDGTGKLVRRDLVIGLREPDDPITALAADITEMPAGRAVFAPASVRRLFTFAGGTREGVRSQLSSLEYVPAWSGFLITTSSEDRENRYHGNTLWFLPDSQLSPDRPATPQRVWLFGKGIKVEGICVLPGTVTVTEVGKPLGVVARDVLRCALVYDNDASRTRLPALLQTVTLIRWSD